MPNCLKSSLDENAGFSSLFHTFRLIWLYIYAFSTVVSTLVNLSLKLPKCTCEAPDIKKKYFNHSCKSDYHPNVFEAVRHEAYQTSNKCELVWSLAMHDELRCWSQTVALYVGHLDKAKKLFA